MNGDCPTSCPFGNGRSEAYDLPLGQVHRVAPVLSAGTPDRTEVDETKRNLLKLLAIAGVVGAAGGGLVGGTLQYAQPPLVGAKSYPKVQLIDLDGAPLTATKMGTEYNVTTSDLYLFSYPLTNEPNFLLNLAPATSGGPGATQVKGGVGPTGSIVAYSAICQHLGCPAPAISYYPPGTCSKTFGPKNLNFYIHCSCHGSTYDVTNQAANLTGPAVLPLPQVTLLWNDPATGGDDTIYAVGESASPPVNGHFETLAGGYQVPNSVQLQKQSPIILCQFPSA
ncbi:MAG TPA: Rieske 2Fe-2S domain-containing protein [Thermoplasmata archaeon]|nr:Rieske 2Fe-2S domain-containing protein [Thermoplasmata archaeon]